MMMLPLKVLQWPLLVANHMPQLKLAANSMAENFSVVGFWRERDLAASFNFSPLMVLDFIDNFLFSSLFAQVSYF